MQLYGKLAGCDIVPGGVLGFTHGIDTVNLETKLELTE